MHPKKENGTNLENALGLEKSSFHILKFKVSKTKLYQITTSYDKSCFCMFTSCLFFKIEKKKFSPYNLDLNPQV